jgi:hypothetical protein
VAADENVSGGGVPGAPEVAGAPITAAPHPGQNVAFGGIGRPQCAQVAEDILCAISSSLMNPPFEPP